MSELNSSRERLDAAVEAKALSSYPHLKRAIQRSWFVVILFTLALPMLAFRAFERDFDAEILFATAVDASLVVGAWWFSLLLIRSFRAQQWERLLGLLGVGARVILVLAVLVGLAAAVCILVWQQMLPAILSGLAGVGILVWRNDYVRARENLVAMLAQRALTTQPVDPAQQAIASRKQWAWIAGAIVAIWVLAGVSWLTVDASRARNAAQTEAQTEKRRAATLAEEERIVAAYDAAEAAKAKGGEPPGIITLSEHENWVSSVAFSPDGRTLASASFDKTVRLWDVASGKTMATLSGHEDQVNSVAFSPDGRSLASGSKDNAVRLWNVASGKPTATLSGHASSVIGIAYSPDGRTLASGSVDNTVRLWDVTSGKTRATLSGHENQVNRMAFSPNGRTLASGSKDNTVRLWDVASGKGTATLSGHTGPVSGVAFSPDGRTLASGSADNTVRLWDVASGKTRATLEGHKRAAYGVAFSPDGRTLASGSQDFTVRLWDVAEGKSLATLSGHKESVSSVAFSPDGRTLASGSLDNTVRLWPISQP